MQHQEDARDPCLPLMIWLAYEPRVATSRPEVLAWLQEHASGNTLVTDEIVPRVMRRILATDEPEAWTACVVLLGQTKDSAIRFRALEGILQATENRVAEPPAQWKAVFTDLLKDADPSVKHFARRLAVKLKDLEAFRLSLAL